MFMFIIVVVVVVVIVVVIVVVVVVDCRVWFIYLSDCLFYYSASPLRVRKLMSLYLYAREIVYMRKPSCGPMFKPPSLGPP